jgi:hypothetical protein
MQPGKNELVKNILPTTSKTAAASSFLSNTFAIWSDGPPCYGEHNISTVLWFVIQFAADAIVKTSRLDQPDSQKEKGAASVRDPGFLTCVTHGVG